MGTSEKAHSEGVKLPSNELDEQGMTGACLLYTGLHEVMHLCVCE